MSVTVSDLLNLPSLKHSRVIAGKKGLNKIVSSISVLETSDTDILVDGLFRQGEFFGSEIVITGFLNCVDDVDVQCANIRRLAEGGEIGLILYYVGIYMPAVDKRLIDLANSLDFVLIQMPKSKNLRYGEVITEVSEYIFNDRSKNESIVSDILARVSMLPEHQRTINTVLRMVSDEIKASVLLTDISMNLLNLAAWPQSIEEELKADLTGILHSAESETAINGTHVCVFPIAPDDNPPLNLVIIKENAPLDPVIRSHVSDIVRICINIWGKGHGNVALHELFRAILQDDPLKMRRLADIFHINIADIHDFWILSGENRTSAGYLEKKKDMIRTHVESCSETVICDVYDDDLLIFASTPCSESEAVVRVEEILSSVRSEDDTITLTKFSDLQNTREVRNAYLDYKQYLNYTKKAFPLRTWFSGGNIAFTKECHEIIDRGEDSISPYNALFSKLRTTSRDWDAAETFGTYALDAEYSITATAEILHIHKNTVKYRLSVIDNTLGYRHDKMPDSIKMYYAAALYRLLK